MRKLSKSFCAASLCAALVATVSAAKADETSPVKDRRIGFVESHLHWSLYQTADGKAECPQGLNAQGPREIFKELFPNGGTVVGTELAREGLKVYPDDHPAQFPYLEAQGNIAIGLNLDGKIGPRDFTSPDGEKGIDNAFYRVIGCNALFRGPEGQLQLFADKETWNYFNRMMIEVSGVDNLENDPNVDVTIYRGRDPLMLDATGDVGPGGTQRIETHYGKSLIQHLHGKIENGVLTTDPINEGRWPWEGYGEGSPRILLIHDMRFRLKLTPTNADGLLAGYVDVNSLYSYLTNWSTHHLAYGQTEAPEFYWAMRRNADAYPDPQTHQNTAISAALTINMAQVFIKHPDDASAKQVASRAQTRTPAEASGR